MNVKRIIGLIFISCILLVGCQKDDYPKQEEKEQFPASLTLTFSSSSILETRGLEDLDDSNNVEEWEKIVDGRQMYRLAVFLINEENEIQAYQELEEDSEGFNDTHTEATVTFTNINHGNYQLLAVANYGTESSLNLTGALSMDPATITATELLNKRIASESDSYLCNKETPYPLTLRKNIVLQPGANTADGELVRTYARIRIGIRNQSAVADLKVSNLDFSDKFTQTNVNLFNTGGNSSVSPVLTSEDAIHAFSETTVPKIVGTDDNMKVNEAVLFDGYLLESENNDGYSYTLAVDYVGGNVVDDKNTVNSTTTLNSRYNGRQFLFKAQNGGFLYANGTTVSVDNSSQDVILAKQDITSYLWTFEENGISSYKIKSVSTGRYISSNASLSNSGQNWSFSDNNSALRISYYNYSTCYLVVEDYNLEYTYNRNKSSNFIFYPIIGASKTITIPISVIDKQTGEANPITAIQRNDLINILITANYNEKLGHFTFEVADWKQIQGGVTFD
ncbi:MAG: hypothetical protein IJD84_05495 [Parabacteroides sp.]|nr:hypothetical protein [Parabacteroides sp.]